ncbi:membrane hypothetical protein [Rhodospirillaceae bacterium LM-1]|nr:membrane hypothetical protein [Rhodospirillaceae bacterium LM-1]
MISLCRPVEVPRSRGAQVVGLGLLFLVILVFTNRHQWAADISRSADDCSYLSYALTLALDGDLDFSNEPVMQSSFSAHYGTPKHFYGPGLLAAPFVALFSVIDRWQGHPVIADHFTYVNSWSYFGFSFAVNFYFLLGLLLYCRGASLLGVRRSALFVVLVCVGSGVIYYVIARPRMAHGFEFFALALTLYASIAMCQTQRRAWVLLCALGVFLTLAVRPSNVNVCWLPVTTALLLGCAGPAKQLRPGWFLAPIAAAFLGLLLLFAVNLGVYDSIFPQLGKLYGHQRNVLPLPAQPSDLLPFLGTFVSLLPKLLHIYFGAEFGLLYTNPVLVFGVISLLLVLVNGWREGNRNQAILGGLLSLAYLALALAIALIWRIPADSYGWRLLYALFPLCWLGYILCDMRLQSHSWLRNTLGTALLLLSLNGMIGALLFTKSPALSYSFGINSFGIENNKADDFNVNLLREMFSTRTWDTAVKDGLVGYVRKNIFIKHNSTRDLPKTPENPPVVGLWYCLLALLWVLFYTALIRSTMPRGPTGTRRQQYPLNVAERSICAE